MQLRPTLRRRQGGALSAWPDLDLLEHRMQRLMQPLQSLASEGLIWAPPVDFTEENGTYVLTAELPGIEPDDVEIEVEGNVLSIRGEKKLEREHADERVQIAERRYGAFERIFTLPTSADPEKVNAEFHQGILRLQIEKRAEARGKKIPVQSRK